MYKNNKNNQRGFWKKYLGPNGRRFMPRSANIKNQEKFGPADSSIPELRQHYFDYSGVSEADRYISSKKIIEGYMGSKYGGNIRTTLEKGQKFKIPVPEDPEMNYVDAMDENGVVIKTAKDQVSYMEQKAFENEI